MYEVFCIFLTSADSSRLAYADTNIIGTWLVASVFLFSGSIVAIAQTSNAHKLIPILALLLGEGDAKYPEEAEIQVGDANLIEAFIGKDINQGISVTALGEDITDQFTFELVTNPLGISISPTGKINYIPGIGSIVISD